MKTGRFVKYAPQDHRKSGRPHSFPISRLLLDRTGIALLVTLGVIAVLIPTVLQLHRFVRSGAAAAYASRDRIALSETAASGVHAAMALLVAEKAERDSDSLAEPWADSEIMERLGASLAPSGTRLSVRISDEMSRIQVNALVDFPQGQNFREAQRLLWDRFLQQLSIENELFLEIDTPMILNCLKDWLDTADDEAITGLNGAESDYYEALTPPYAARNGPISHIDELTLVRGLSRLLVYGNGREPGLSSYLTVLGAEDNRAGGFLFNGKININTASFPVLQALLPPENADLATAIYEYRTAAVEDKMVDLFSNPNWYREAPGCRDVRINPELVTIASDIFRVESTASKENRQVVLTAVVQRFQDTKSGRWTPRILRWEIK